MQINRIGVVVRPRNPWESIDLGFSLIQQWWRPFYRVWLAIIIPFILILNLLCYPIAWLAPLIIWWLKPFFDRIILHFLSRALFGELLGIHQMVRALPTFLNFKLLLSLTIGRFDFARSFNLPVLQLEGLRGKVQSQRIRLLQQRTRNYATGLTMICLHFEGLVYLSLFGLLYLMVPADYATDWSWSRFFLEDSILMRWLNIIFSTIVLSIIEPIYVSSGFTLYLNRRTHLEGWDIELVFRRIAMTLQTSAKTALLLLLTLTVIFLGSPFVATPLFAMPSAPEQVAPETIQQTMTTILQQPEFQTHRQVDSWQFKGTPSTREEDHSEYHPLILMEFIKWIAQLIEFLLWVGLGILIIVVARYALTWGQRLRQQVRSPPASSPQKVRSVSRVVSEPFSFTQLAERAYHLWQTGETFAALSLLYRGTLMALITYHGVTIAESATEGECLRSVKASHQPLEMIAYFTALTRIWQNAAYAQRLPATETMQQLCTDWQQHFGHFNQNS